MPLYLIRNSFRNGGNFYKAGSLIEDLSSIKLAKIRLNQRDIIEVPEDEEKLEQLRDWFQIRHQVDLHEVLAERESKGSEPPEPEKPSASANPTTPGTKPAVQPTVVIKPMPGVKPQTK